MTFSLQLDQIDAPMLEALKTNGVREDRQLDYKEALPGGSDEEKREFLSDITSFANAAGGDIIFGVRERREDGKPTGEIDAIVGLPALNVDAERLRLEAVIRDSVAPRMPPVTFHEIRRDPAESCLLVRIPRSWAGLHMVIFKNLSRFYSRTSGGKYQLDVHEIRAGFANLETAQERLQRFRADRVARIVALETPIPLGPGPKLMLHALPFASSEDVWSRFLAMTDPQRAKLLAPLGGHADTWRFDLDGFVLQTLRSDPSLQSYLQVFRDGGIESVSGGLVVDERRTGFYMWGYEERIIQRFKTHQEFWRLLGITSPLLVGLSFSGLKGLKVLQGPWGWAEQEAVIDRDVVVAPEVVLSDLTSPPDVALRPIFDLVWNGGGWPGSPNYRDGRWIGPR